VAVALGDVTVQSEPDRAPTIRYVGLPTRTASRIESTALPRRRRRPVSSGGGAVHETVTTHARNWTPAPVIVGAGGVGRTAARDDPVPPLAAEYSADAGGADSPIAATMSASATAVRRRGSSDLTSGPVGQVCVPVMLTAIVKLTPWHAFGALVERVTAAGTDTGLDVVFAATAMGVPSTPPAPVVRCEGNASGPTR